MVLPQEVCSYSELPPTNTNTVFVQLEAVLSQRHDDMKAFRCSRDGAGCSVIGTTLLVTMAASLCRCSASLRPPEGAAVCCWRHRGPNTEDRWRQRRALEPLDPRTDEIETADIRVPLSKALKRVNLCYSKAASVNQ